MNETILTDQTEKIPLPAVSNAFRTIVFGGLTVGTLDAIAACINAGIKGVSPNMVFHYIASGLIGRDASYNGGAPTVFLGVLLHCTIGFGVASAFYILSRNFPILLRRALICGMFYGIAVYFVMGYVIVPLSAAPKIPFSLPGMITSIVIHIFCVGLPVTLWAKFFANGRE